MAKAESLYDTSSVPSTENSSPALIDKAGITHNLKVAIALKDGDYKAEDKKGQKWHGFEVVLTDPDGLQITELYFQPPTCVEEVNENIILKKYEVVDGRSVETRDQNKQEMLITLNNEFLAYLVDLGSSFGHNEKDVKEYLYKNTNKGFIGLAQAFIDKYKPTEKTRISAKLLWENNKKRETSYLKIHGSYTTYFPFGNDLFDIYTEGRPTLLKISKYEQDKKMKKLYTGTSDAPAGDSKQGVTKTGDQGYKAMVDSDEDPF